MNQVAIDKRSLRYKISNMKKSAGEEELIQRSGQILAKLENAAIFENAKHILAYASLPFEVETLNALNRWSITKQIYLPIVVGEELHIRKFTGVENLRKGAFNVWEPIGELLEDLSMIDLIIIPGVAFSTDKMRMGYGKGFYDRLLPQINGKKIGICFDFQLFEQIPTESHDQPIDMIFSESQIVL